MFCILRRVVLLTPVFSKVLSVTDVIASIYSSVSCSLLVHIKAKKVPVPAQNPPRAAAVDRVLSVIGEVKIF